MAHQKQLLRLGGNRSGRWLTAVRPLLAFKVSGRSGGYEAVSCRPTYLKADRQLSPALAGTANCCHTPPPKSRHLNDRCTLIPDGRPIHTVRPSLILVAQCASVRNETYCGRVPTYRMADDRAGGLAPGLSVRVVARWNDHQCGVISPHAI
jgi:hypothetical protein